MSWPRHYPGTRFALSNDAYVQDLYRILLGANLHWQDREAWVYSKGVHTRSPFQGAWYGLTPKVITLDDQRV